MKTAREFKKLSLDSLKGKWCNAIIVGLISTFLYAISQNEIRFGTYVDSDTTSLILKLLYPELHMGYEVDLFKSVPLYAVAIFFILWFLYSLFGSIINIGYSKYNLNLADNMEVNTKLLFSYFEYWKNIICTHLLEYLYILLSFCLLVVPGIIATYSYAMTGYILAENPELSASEVLYLSKRMMNGNRLRLFHLQFSFIGWEILCAFSLGVGNLWLTPYKNAAYAYFYREVSKNIKIK